MHTPAHYRGEGVRLRYFGHACVLIESGDTTILLDPVHAWDVGKGDGRFTFNDLPPRIDYVVLSHNHQDHCVPEVLLQLRHRVNHVIAPANNSGSITDPSLKLLLRQLGFSSVLTVDAFDEVRFADGRIISLPFPGEHVDLDIHSRHGIYIEIRTRRFTFLVDSDVQDPVLFERITRRIDKRVDALFLGMECHGAPLSWLYGPMLTRPIARRDDESRRLSSLDSARAWQVLQRFAAARAFVYAMGQEPWMKYMMGLQYTPESIQLREIASFLERCREAGIPAEQLYLRRELEF
jgi:L-ascorbate metabolism protein UlaG (beta-lactamase superfamily)